MPLVRAVTAPGLVWAAMLLIMAYPGAKPVHAAAEVALCPPAPVVPVGHDMAAGTLEPTLPPPGQYEFAGHTDRAVAVALEL